MTYTASTHPLRSRCIDALSYRLPAEAGTWDDVIRRLEQAKFRGAVVGPHGTGKTTFLLSLQEALQQRGTHVLMLFTNTDHGRRIPSPWIDALQDATEETVVIADGYDVLSRWERWRLRNRLRPRGGLLVTAHTPAALPTVFQTATTADLLIELVTTLYEQQDQAPPERTKLRKMFEQYDGNLREVMRQLYVEK